MEWKKDAKKRWKMLQKKSNNFHPIAEEFHLLRT